MPPLMIKLLLHFSHGLFLLIPIKNTNTRHYIQRQTLNEISFELSSANVYTPLYIKNNDQKNAPSWKKVLQPTQAQMGCVLDAMCNLFPLYKNCNFRLNEIPISKLLALYNSIQVSFHAVHTSKLFTPHRLVSLGCIINCVQQNKSQTHTCASTSTYAQIALCECVFVHLSLSPLLLFVCGS